jgi:hypothetical protein
VPTATGGLEAANLALADSPEGAEDRGRAKTPSIYIARGRAELSRAHQPPRLVETGRQDPREPEERSRGVIEPTAIVAEGERHGGTLVGSDAQMEARNTERLRSPNGDPLEPHHIEAFLKSRGRDPETVAYLPPNVTRRQFHKQFRPSKAEGCSPPPATSGRARRHARARSRTAPRSSVPPGSGTPSRSPRPSRSTGSSQSTA